MSPESGPFGVRVACSATGREADELDKCDRFLQCRPLDPPHTRPVVTDNRWKKMALLCLVNSRVLRLSGAIALYFFVGVTGAGANPAQTAYLKVPGLQTGSTGGSGSNFGNSVAIDGDIAVVGSPGRSLEAGGASIFVRNPDGTWVFQDTIVASNAEPGDRFGAAVAIAGTTIVVGAPDEDSGATGVDGTESDNSLSNPGAAYVFVRGSNGGWTQQAYLKASSPGPAAFDDFGTAVAIDGDRIVVGDSGKDAGGNDTGAAFVFERSGSTWTAATTLTAFNTQALAGFGGAVSISGDTIIIGARNESSDGTGINADPSSSGFNGSGAAYEFVRNQDGTWSENTFFKASNAEDNDSFGAAVSIDGDMLVIGARNEDSGIVGDEADNSASAAGAAYVFSRDSSGDWSQQAYLKAANLEASDLFGWSVAAQGNHVLIGARDESSAATGINGDASDNSATAAGAAYLFQRATDGSWSQQRYIKASNTDPGDRFGWAVDISAERLIVGAPFEDSAAESVDGNQLDNSVDDIGAAYVFGPTAAGGTFTVSGTVTGLSGSVTLQNNGTDDLTMLANGGFNFPAPVPDGSPYEVTILTQPQGQTCTVNNGEGTIDGEDVDDVQIACADDGVEMFDIGGTISGLESGNTISVVVRDASQGGVSQPGRGNGLWNFVNVLPDGAGYEVSVSLVPVGQACTVDNGTGTIDGADIDDVIISCGPRITSIPTSGPDGNVTVSLVTTNGASAGCSLAAATTMPPPLDGPDGFDLPFGVVDFSAVGCTGGDVTVELTFDEDISGATFFKFLNDTWQELPGAVISGNTARFAIADNGPFDADPAAGIIRDPSGPGFAEGPTPIVDSENPARPIPALTPALLSVLAAVFALVGMGRLRRRLRR